MAADLEKSRSQMEQARDAAVTASRVKSEFLANMSHEIRTPMNGILGLSEILMEASLNPELRITVEQLHASAFALLDLLNDVLDLSKIEAGRLDLEQVAVDVRATVHQAVDTLAPRANAKSLGLTVGITDSVPVSIVSDPVRLRQILLNLVSNAIKFTERGSVRVQVDCQRNGAGDMMLRCTVRDTGIGVPTDKQGLLFQAFSQLDGSTTRRFGGTGLGLSICKHLVDLFRGSISVESTPGQGSTFCFCVPCQPAEPQAGGNTAVGAVQTDVAVSPLSILVVEDNPINQRVIVHILRRKGCAVAVAADGRDALAQWSAGAFDLVLMDVQMPELDGLQATVAIRSAERESGRHTPIIALTANTLDHDRDRCLQAGMDDYLTKPVQAAVLWQAIERHQRHRITVRS